MQYLKKFMAGIGLALIFAIFLVVTLATSKAPATETINHESAKILGGIAILIWLIVAALIFVHRLRGGQERSDELSVMFFVAYFVILGVRYFLYRRINIGFNFSSFDSLVVSSNFTLLPLLVAFDQFWPLKSK